MEMIRIGDEYISDKYLEGIKYIDNFYVLIFEKSNIILDTNYPKIKISKSYNYNSNMSTYKYNKYIDTIKNIGKNKRTNIQTREYLLSNNIKERMFFDPKVQEPSNIRRENNEYIIVINEKYCYKVSRNVYNFIMNLKLSSEDDNNNYVYVINEKEDTNINNYINKKINNNTKEKISDKTEETNLLVF